MGQHMVKHIQLKSPAFRDNGMIPERFTCDGENINPILQLMTPNPDTRTYALIMEDPDAPRGTYTHWLLWNIEADITEIQENAIPPAAVQGVNSAGEIGYTGPCPPYGEHRYHFRLFALDTFLALPEGATRPELEAAMKGHILDQATLSGRYQRP